MKKYSDDHLFENYKFNLRKERRFVFGWQFIIVVSFFIIWETASRFYWIDPLIFSSPSKVFNLLFEKFLDGSMLLHVQVTLFETVLGFILGTILGIAFATILWSSTRLAKIMGPYLVILNAMPKVALGPIIIVALGPGYISIISMGILVSVIITTIVVYSAFNEV